MNSFLCVSYAEYSTRFSPSCTVLYCTIPAIPQTQSSCISVSYPFTNAVGYKTTSAITGISQKISAFDAVSAGAVNIQDIVPVVGEGEELYSGGFVIMALTDGGETAESFTYTLAADASDGIAKDGWFDDLGNRATKTYLPAEGFVLVSDYETGALTTSGQVATEDTIFSLGTGINSCGNSTSGEVTIDKITVGVGVNEEGELLSTNDAEEEIYSGGLVIMMLTDGGETAESFTFTLAADASDGVAKDGWFDDLGNRATKPFDAGEGFIVVSDYAESYIKLPSAL